MRTPEEQEALFDRMEAFLNDYAKADNEFQTNQRKSNWNNKFGERFAPYAEKLKQLNGDDFDIVQASFDEYEKDYSDLSDDEYCDALENNIKATLQRIWPEAEPEKIEQAVEEVKETVKEEEPAGEEPAKEEIHIESEDKDGDGEISKDETEVHAMEEKPEGDEESEPAAETEQEADESEEDRFVKDLEDYKAKMPKRG